MEHKNIRHELAKRGHSNPAEGADAVISKMSNLAETTRQRVKDDIAALENRRSTLSRELNDFEDLYDSGLDSPATRGREDALVNEINKLNRMIVRLTNVVRSL